MKFHRRLITTLLLSLTLTSRAAVIESDICVYGGTSGGVTAAVAAARLGKTVTLLTQNNHVGGMTASGLGVTDIGVGNDPSYIGGISREFYKRVGAAYGSTNLIVWFEPHVAENVFWQMLTEASVPVYSNQLLAAATVISNRITQITTLDGTIFRAKQFIDTSYEGDLMAAAGVTFTVGREATSTYGESLAGVRGLGGSFTYDPYVVPGNPGSGLLPFVQPGTIAPVGSADHRLQAFNFRLCLTQNATNKIPITAPTNYVEANYELFRRYLDARVASNGTVQLNQLIHVQQIIPNGKTDINANGELSTDYVGASYTWATNTHAGRETIRAEHENYIRGMLHFFATSPNVPLNVRTQMQSWGLAADEFTDNGGWPWQIYVREARRMVSDYVMIEQNATGVRIAPEPICLGRYTIDSHGVQRLASGNAARWEGSIGGSVPFPYPISYRSIIPRTGECVNVYSTFALSASHVGFSSCRMEPVFMMTSQGAATAAAFAIDDNVPAQQVNYAKLAAQLRADGQILSWAGGSSQTNGIIIDQTDTNAFIAGAWTFGANAGGWNTNYLHDQSTGKGSKSVRYVPTITNAGPYEVFLWWVESSNRPTNTPVDVIHAAGTNRVFVNQKLSSGGWFKIMTTNFNVGTNGGVIIRNDGTAAGTFVIADGVRFVPVGSAAPPPTPPVVELVASDAVANEFTAGAARFVIVRNGGETNLPALAVSYTIGGNAAAGVDYGALSGSVTLASGAAATNIFITPIADSAVEGDETVALTLQPSPNYTLNSLSNATAIIRDQPVDAWRKTNFTAGELGNSASSGDLANPDGDSLANLMEYALGLPPKIAGTNAFAPRIENGYLTLTYTRAKAATDVSLTLEKSDDLSTWQNTPGLFQQVSLVDSGATETITVRLSSPISAVTTAYIRLKVTRL
ncbi:MAG: FAD-dependent oxidoreductase [Verrucomicrobiota bacterium]